MILYCKIIWAGAGARQVKEMKDEVDKLQVCAC